MTGRLTTFLAAAALAFGAISSAPALAETYRCELEPTTLQTRQNTPVWIEIERTDNGAAFLLMTSIMDEGKERTVRAKISRETGSILGLTWRDNVRRVGNISLRYDFRLTVNKATKDAALQGRVPRGKPGKLDIGARGACSASP